MAEVDFEIWTCNGEWTPYACKFGSLLLEDADEQILKAVCSVAAVLVLKMILCFKKAYQSIVHKDKDAETIRFETREYLETGGKGQTAPASRLRKRKRTAVAPELEGTIDPESD